jgi:hypothetical protein
MQEAGFCGATSVNGDLGQMPTSSSSLAEANI